MVQVRDDSGIDRTEGRNGPKRRDTEHILVVEPGACWWSGCKKWGGERDRAWLLGVWPEQLGGWLCCLPSWGRLVIHPIYRTAEQAVRNRLPKFIHVVRIGARIQTQACPNCLSIEFQESKHFTQTCPGIWSKIHPDHTRPLAGSKLEECSGPSPGTTGSTSHLGPDWKVHSHRQAGRSPSPGSSQEEGFLGSSCHVEKVEKWDLQER